MWLPASSSLWWNSTPSCSCWEWGSSARLTRLPALSNATDTTIPLLQQQLGTGEMPFQIFLCKGVIHPGYPKGHSGYNQGTPPGWEGFLTLWKKHPHHQKQIPQGKSCTVHRNLTEVQREGRHTTPAQSPFLPSEQGYNPLQSRVTIICGSRLMISVSFHHQHNSSCTDTSGQWLLTSCCFLQSHLTKHIKTTL